MREIHNVKYELQNIKKCVQYIGKKNNINKNISNDKRRKKIK